MTRIVTPCFVKKIIPRALLAGSRFPDVAFIEGNDGCRHHFPA
jgi:hypothetical protein